MRQAVYAAKIISYAQGFMLLKKAGEEFGWGLNFGAIALMWRGGCIIRRYPLKIRGIDIDEIILTAFSWVISLRLLPLTPI